MKDDGGTPIDTESEFGKIIAGFTPKATVGPLSSLFWGIIAWLFVLAIWVAATLAITAMFWGLYLLARLLWQGMGL